MGIDPGMSGGLAIINQNGFSPVIYAFKDKTNADIASVLEKLFYIYDCFCYIENVHSMPEQGRVSIFTFGKNYGGLLMALACFKIPYTTVSPVKWQRHLRCLSRGDKKVTRAKAQELFPDIKVTHAIADALLIAEYGRQIRV